MQFNHKHEHGNKHEHSHEHEHDDSHDHKQNQVQNDVHDQRTLDIKAIAVWRMSTGIGQVIVGIFVAALLVVGYYYHFPWWIGFICVVLFVLESIITIVIIPAMTWKHWRYEIREEEVELARGIFFKKRTIVPMVRIQHVDTKQGPLLRKYGLASVTFSTAAGEHEIPALAVSIADDVRNQIVRLAKVSDDDV